jgi:hypothetical protein
LVVKGGGSVALNAYGLNINSEEGFGRLNAKTNVESVLYFEDTVVTVMMATNDFIITGCAECITSNGGNYGWLHIYDPVTLKRLNVVEGQRGRTKVGNDASYNMNTDYTDQIWYTSTSTNGNEKTFNSVLTFKNVDTGEWDFYDKQDVFYVDTNQNLVY